MKRLQLQEEANRLAEENARQQELAAAVDSENENMTDEDDEGSKQDAGSKLGRSRRFLIHELETKLPFSGV